MDKLEHMLIAEAQKARTLARIEAQREETRARFNRAPGLKQFTSPEERPLRHSFRDDTANMAISRASR